MGGRGGDDEGARAGVVKPRMEVTVLSQVGLNALVLVAVSCLLLDLI